MGKLGTWVRQAFNAARTVRTKHDGSEHLLHIGRTASGIYVDQIQALRLATVWACVRVISESLAALPWHVYQRDAEKRKRLDSHPAAWLLGNQANPETTAFSFVECMTAGASLWGDCFAEIERDASGRPVWLWQLKPWCSALERDGAGALVLRYRNDDGTDSIIPYADVFHIHGPSLDGLSGLNPIKYASDSIGLGLAMEQFGSAFFGNGSSPAGVFQSEVGMSPEAVLNFKTAYREATQGARKARQDLILPKGMTWKQVSIPPEESQFNDSRYQQVEEVARRFRVPPHKIGHLLRSTNNNIEHQSIEFVQDCLMPWCLRLEQEANIKLFGRAMQGRAYTKFNLASALRGDLKSQYDAFRIGRAGGWLSANDVRRLIDMDPIGPHGDTYQVPLNTISAEYFDAFSEKQTKVSKPAAALPAPADEPTDDPNADDPNADEPTDDPNADPVDEVTARRNRVAEKTADMLRIVHGGRNA